MRPGSGELLDAIADALDRQVLPAVEDRWAASTLRSAVQLLRHLALRVECEPQLLPQQAAALRKTLRVVEPMLTAPGLSDLRAGINSALQRPSAPTQDLVALDVEIDSLQRAAEAVIAARDRVLAATGAPTIHNLLISCCTERLAAEASLITPFQSTPPI
jgi:hypothetical protein